MSIRHLHSGRTLDAFRLSREHGVAEGRVDAHQLERVDDVLADGPATIRWRIEGIADAAGRPALSIELAGAVSLTCQRCLDDFEWTVDQRTEVLLARDERELAMLDVDTSSEVVLAAAPIEPLTLVEDELVLALPFAPRHPDEACITKQHSRAGRGE
jgi:uncharacterized protein